MPLPAGFNEQAGLLQQGALAYCAAVRQPGQKAEDIIPGLIAWLHVQTTPDNPVLTVVSVLERSVTTKTFSPSSNPLTQGQVDETDTFEFGVESVFPDGTQAVTGVAIPRSAIEG